MMNACIVGIRTLLNMHLFIYLFLFCMLPIFMYFFVCVLCINKDVKKNSVLKKNLEIFYLTRTKHILKLSYVSVLSFHFALNKLAYRQIWVT